MSFYERFELLDLVRDDGIKTFAAREIPTGRAVLVHLILNPRAPLNVALLSKLKRLPAEELTRIVDRGENNGTPYVVTGPLDGHAGFREWLIAQGKQEKAAAPPPPPAPPLPVTAEAPSLGVAAAWNVVTQAPPPRPQTPVPPPVPPPDPEPSLDDQFASLFETVEPSLPPPPRPPVIAAAPDDDETLRLPSAPAPPPLAKPPGEFPRMFQQPSGPSAEPPPLPSPPPPLPEVQQPLTPQVFGPRDVASPQPPPLPISSQPAGGTPQSFATPQMPPPLASSYPQMFSAQAPLLPSQPAPGTAPAAPSSSLPFFLGLGVVVLALVLFLVFRAR